MGVVEVNESHPDGLGRCCEAAARRLPQEQWAWLRDSGEHVSRVPPLLLLRAPCVQWIHGSSIVGEGVLVLSGMLRNTNHPTDQRVLLY